MLKESELIANEYEFLAQSFKILSDRQKLLAMRIDAFENKLRNEEMIAQIAVFERSLQSELAQSQLLGSRIKDLQKKCAINVSTLGGKSVSIPVPISQSNFSDFMKKVSDKFGESGLDVTISDKTSLIVNGKRYTNKTNELAMERMVDDAISTSKIFIVDQSDNEHESDTDT